MGRRLLAWGACWGLLLAAGCTALDGLDRSFNEVDCFPAGSCADATAEGATADGSSGSGGDTTTTTDAKQDGTALDAQGDGDAGPANNDGGGDAGGEGGHEGGSEAGSDGGADASEGGCPSSDLACAGGCVANGPANCGACGHDCTNLQHVSGTVTCTAGGACSFPLSACTQGWTHCSANPDQGCETDISSTASCGGCGNACTGGTPVCAPSGASYVCASGCQGTQTLCSGSCVDTTSNSSDCKTCGNVCTTSVAHAQATCVSSTCTTSCNSGYTSCNGGCVDELNDNSNCGGCGSAFACPSGGTCTNGMCQCPTGDLACGGVCAVCSTPLNGSPACSGTACGYSCKGGYTSCAGGCWNTTSDTLHCGASCSACTALDACHTAGTCSGSACSNPTQPDGTGCGTNETCQGGVCTCITMCNSSCVNTNFDNNNCGSCAHVCPTLSAPSTGTSCSNAKCVGDLGGYPVGGTTPGMSLDTIYAVQVTVPAPATVQTLNVQWSGGVVVPTAFWMGIYSDSGGLPSTLIFNATTTANSCPSTVVIGAGSVSLPANTYWIALSSNWQANPSVEGTMGLNCVQAGSIYSAAGMPSTFPSPATACSFSNVVGSAQPGLYLGVSF